MSDRSFARCRAEVLLYTGPCSPVIVTERTGIEPSGLSVKGRVVGPNRVGRWRVESTNLWFLDSATEVEESSELFVHLDWLVERIRDAHQIRSMVEEFELDSRIRCVWWPLPGRGGGPNISPRHLRWMADCGFVLEFDLGGEIRG